MATCTIESLPEEVLEFILSLVSPYKDLHECMLVSKRWKNCVLNVVRTRQRNFYKAINESDVVWHKIVPTDMAPSITKRYSHNAVVHDNSMYIFGGCRCAMTTFNDLWKLDLSKRQWIRPLAMGTYPSPKACSSLVKYKDMLVLFGGWASPPSYPLYQNWQLFNELHVYDTTVDRWTCINTINTPPPIAGHSVTVVGEWMVVFGGLCKPNNSVHCEKSNNIWKLNLERWTWVKQEVEAGEKPSGRFGQTQVLLNNENLFILGGSGGPTLNYSDAWILNMSGELWKWIKVDIKGKSDEPLNLWSSPGCKIGNKVVILNRVHKTESISVLCASKSQWRPVVIPEDPKQARIDLAHRNMDIDENVNGKRGSLRNQKREVNDDGEENFASSRQIKINVHPETMSMAAFNDSVENAKSSESLRMKAKRLANLLRVQENMAREKGCKGEKKTHYLGIYILDVSTLLNGDGRPVATWIPPKKISDGPEETILYSLVEGKSELVMFGGILKDDSLLKYSPNLSTSQISNSVWFISAANYVI